MPYSQLFRLPINDPRWLAGFSRLDTGLPRPRGPNSQLLKKLSLPDDPTTVNCNDWPAYYEGRIDHAIHTSGIASCTGLALINKAKRWHYIGHITATISDLDIAKHLRGRANLLNGASIYIKPGISLSTVFTIRNVISALTMIDPHIADRVQFVHTANFGDRVAVFNGEICDADFSLSWSTRSTRIPGDESTFDMKLDSSNQQTQLWAKSIPVRAIDIAVNSTPT